MIEKLFERSWFGSLLLLALGCACYLPFVGRDFGPLEANGGTYFGVFARNFDKFGFVELRGMPVGWTLLESLLHAHPYTHHPFAGAWIYAALGTEIWQIRLPGMLATVGSAALFHLVWHRRLGPLAALVAGLVFLVVPVMFFYSQVSYEPLILFCAAGLYWVLAWGDEAVRSSRLRNTLVVAICFLGSWIDLIFVWVCLSLVAVHFMADRSAMLRRLALPAVVSLFGVGTALTFASYAARNPEIINKDSVVDPLSLLERGGLSNYLSKVSEMLVETHTLWLLLVILPGLFLLWRRDRRAFFVFALLGLPNVIVFGKHALNHHLFYALLVPLLAAACGVLSAVLCRHVDRRLRWLALPVLAAAVVAPALRSHALIDRATTSFYADLGRVMNEAIGEQPARYAVGCGMIGPYGYYLDSELIHTMTFDDPDFLDVARKDVKVELGLRYVWLRLRGGLPHRVSAFQERPAMAGFLAPFEKRRLPELEGDHDVYLDGHPLEIYEAWIVTLKEPTLR